MLSLKKFKSMQIKNIYIYNNILFYATFKPLKKKINIFFNNDSDSW